MNISSWIFNMILGLGAQGKLIGKPEAGIIQKKQLLKLLRKAKNTKFGLDHHFANIESVEGYQINVPLRSYNEFWEQYWKSDFPKLENVTWPGVVPYFAKSSGTTTGKSKYIPCSLEMVKANNYAGFQVVFHHFRNKPNSKLLLGRTFLFGGSPDLEKLDENIYCGELSGIAAKETPWWVNKDIYYPPSPLAKIKNWEEKVDALSTDCLGKNIRSIGGVPPWLQILFERIFDKSQSKSRKLADYFPDLELVTYGGVSFTPYLEYFQKILDGTHADLREIYAASEGFIAIADQEAGQGMRMIVNNGIFYEFVKADEIHSDNPKRYWMQDVEEGVDYAVIVSTCAGLWGYIIGDLIRFVDLENLRILVSGRISQTLSVFGEHIVNEELERAVAFAANKQGFSVRDFAVCSIMSKSGETNGYHQYVLEADRALSDDEEKQVSHFIDMTLKEENADYAAKRYNNIAISPPHVSIVAKGTFQAWMREYGKLGGQNKVPRVTDKKIIGELIEVSAAKNTCLSE